MKQEEQEQIQQKYMQLQMMQQQIKQIQQQIQQFEQQIVELNSLSQSLEDFKGLKPGSETLVPISSGIFAKASLKDNDGLLVNVGANTVVKKSVEETKKLIDNQRIQLEEVRQKIAENIDMMTSQAASLEKDLSKAIKD